jgi:hypothetical protein
VTNANCQGGTAGFPVLENKPTKSRLLKIGSNHPLTLGKYSLWEKRLERRESFGLEQAQLVHTLWTWQITPEAPEDWFQDS